MTCYIGRSDARGNTPAFRLKGLRTMSEHPTLTRAEHELEMRDFFQKVKDDPAKTPLQRASAVRMLLLMTAMAKPSSPALPPSPKGSAPAQPSTASSPLSPSDLQRANMRALMGKSPALEPTELKQPEQVLAGVNLLLNPRPPANPALSPETSEHPKPTPSDVNAQPEEAPWSARRKAAFWAAELLALTLIIEGPVWRRHSGDAETQLGMLLGGLVFMGLFVAFSFVIFDLLNRADLRRYAVAQFLQRPVEASFTIISTAVAMLFFGLLFLHGIGLVPEKSALPLILLGAWAALMFLRSRFR